MHNNSDDDERISLLSKSNSSKQKSYRTAGESIDRLSPSEFDSQRCINSITYSWNDINVWSDSDCAGELSARFSYTFSDTPTPGESCLVWPWYKNPSTTPTQIISNSSGVVRPGELLMIMGPAASGKTTLLNVLAFRTTKKLRVSGFRRINGFGVGLETLRTLSAYVEQDHLFVDTLTVRETLIFQAMLRLDRRLSKDSLLVRVDQVLHEFYLTNCANIQIRKSGSTKGKGITDLEIKRLALACELISDPLLIFCDEPTFGIDSFKAQNMISSLQEMAKKGKTIICTIRKPTSELYAMFDHILLLAEGRTAFFGNSLDAVKFFNDQGFECPTSFNPADYFVEILAIQPGNEQTCSKTIAQLSEAFQESEFGQQLLNLSNSEASDDDGKTFEKEVARTKWSALWMTQFSAMLWRFWLTIRRDSMVVHVRFVQALITSLVLSAFYWGQIMDQDGVININGALFLFLICLTLQNVFAVIDSFSLESQIFFREHFKKIYRTDVYILAKTIAELPIFVVFPALSIFICYFAIDLNRSVARLLITCAIVILVSSTSSSFGYFVSCVSPNTSFAYALAPTIIIPLMVFGGFLLNQASGPIYFIWLKYLSWIMYGYEALLINQWEGVKDINCNCNRSNSTCSRNGEIVLKSFNFSKESFNFDILMLVVLMFGYRVLAYFALLAKTYRQWA